MFYGSDPAVEASLLVIGPIVCLGFGPCLCLVLSLLSSSSLTNTCADPESFVRRGRVFFFFFFFVYIFLNLNGVSLVY